MSGLYPYSSQDVFRQRRSPTPVELVLADRNAQWICSRMNATTVASIQGRFYVSTSRGQKSVRRPFVETRSLSTRKLNDLAAGSPTIAKRLDSAAMIEEVVKHPIVDLFDKPNPWIDRFQLIALSQLYLDNVGANYWTYAYPGGNRSYIPAEIWPLPAWMVYPTPDFTGTDVITNYVLTTGGGQTVLNPKDVTYFRALAQLDPYVGTMSPLRAGWDYTQTQDKLIEFEDSALTNRARPDVMLIPTADGGAFSPEEIQRVQMDIYQQFALGGAGGIFVAPGGYDMKPLSWAPRDMGELANMKSTLHAVAMMYGIPVALIDGENANRASYDSALLHYMRFTIKPRCRQLEERINSDLMSRFDERLFFAFDDAVPQDMVVKRETDKAYIQMGVYSPNQIAVEMGVPPSPGGDEKFIPNSLVPLSTALDRDRRNIIAGLTPAKPDEIPDEDRDPQRTPEPPDPEDDVEQPGGQDTASEDEPAGEKAVLALAERVLRKIDADLVSRQSRWKADR